ncbi:transposase [Pyxidicoccus trucidator]|uniref:transposase n=1 Tax=Pyxidicoccus trucidator TaxID=2709662 RepID=UPI0023DDB75F|nr:transposase [Pyxidicoccus trucidator]
MLPLPGDRPSLRRLPLCIGGALRAQCTHAASGRGRSVRLGEDEGLQKRLRRLQGTRSGRAKLRERVHVEHQLAHLSQRQGSRARYRGTRKNTFDLRRLCALQNLETLHRRIDEKRRLAA